MEKVMNEKIIMNYEVVELLHKSSSWGNIVFKVKPQNKEKLYVLKCFPKIENGLQKLIFKREIEALRTLNVCEGIVKLRDSSTGYILLRRTNAMVEFLWTMFRVKL